MDEQFQNLEPSSENLSQPEEMSFLDKMTGIFTEPSKVFENVKFFGPKNSDWVIPILLVILLTVVTNYIVTSNPDIKAELDAIQRKATEEAFNKAVKEGRMTEAQKEEQMEQIEKMTSGPTMRIIQYFSIAVFMFVFLFIIAAVYYLIWVVILKGQGSYSNALSVYGLASFINMVEIILVAIVSLLMVKLITGLGLSIFIEAEKGTTLNYILSKINPFTFWWLYVIGIGLSKVYSVPKNKSLISIFVLWLVYVIVAKFIPFLSFGV